MADISTSRGVTETGWHATSVYIFHLCRWCFKIQIQGLVVSKIGMCVFAISVYPGSRETNDILCGDFIIQPINEQKKK